MSVRILIGGDICPRGRVQSAFIEGRAEAIFGDLLEAVSEADLSIANLECPLVTEDTPIEKAGIALGADARCVRGLRSAGWTALSLANNHSFDHGAQGLLNTIETIKDAGMIPFGAGPDSPTARRPLIRDVHGTRIIVYAMAEREFSVAEDDSPGANPMDLIGVLEALRTYKDQGHFIVLIHGGKEFYPYPSPEMVRRCRFLIDSGADAVICGHAHIAQPWEIHAGRPIVYGLGNLVFEYPGMPHDFWFEGYLARLTIEGPRVDFEAIPYFQSKDGIGARRMDPAASQRFLSDLIEKGKRLDDPAFVRNSWREFCRKNAWGYLEELYGFGRLMSKAPRALVRRLLPRKKILRSLHLVRCETHREVLEALFRLSGDGPRPSGKSFP
jgi:hypothetical protein